jgi:hypothetical protein
MQQNGFGAPSSDIHGHPKCGRTGEKHQPMGDYLHGSGPQGCIQYAATSYVTQDVG